MSTFERFCYFQKSELEPTSPLLTEILYSQVCENNDYKFDKIVRWMELAYNQGKKDGQNAT